MYTRRTGTPGISTLKGIQVRIKHRLPLMKALYSIVRHNYPQLSMLLTATHSPNFVNKSIFKLPCKRPTQHRKTLPTSDRGGKVPKTFAIWSPSKSTGTPCTMALDAAVWSWVVWDGKHKLQQPQQTRAIRQANCSSSSCSSSSHTIICVAQGLLALEKYRREGHEPRFLNTS